MTHIMIVTTARPHRDLMALSRRQHSRRRLTHHHQGREMTLPGGDGILVGTGMRNQLMETPGITQKTGEAADMTKRTTSITPLSPTLQDQLQH